jgi:hypothetical protein
MGSTPNMLNLNFICFIFSKFCMKLLLPSDDFYWIIIVFSNTCCGCISFQLVLIKTASVVAAILDFRSTQKHILKSF